MTALPNWAPPCHHHHNHHQTSTIATIFLSLLAFLILPLNTSITAHSCSTLPSTACPPFTSTPSFPFSSYPGCGHPAFQIQCSFPHSIISINNLTFSLLHYDLNSTSLLLSPTTFPPLSSSSSEHNCTTQHSLFSVPSRPISFSGSPFWVSDSYCSRLSVLKSCSPPNLPNCSQCSWECKLIENPIQLLHECGSSHHQDSQQGCQSDVLEFLDNSLKLGVEVEWDEDQDSYFSSCKACRTNDGSCGYNSSDPKKSFLCFKSPSPRVQEKGANKIAIFCILFLFMCFLIILFVGTVIFRERQKGFSSEEDPTIVFLRRHRSASLLPPMFTYEELESSTNHFDPKRKIGDGGFGSVYLGQLSDGLTVAVKYLHKHNSGTAAGEKGFSTKSFCNEILILSSLSHPNLVKLHGYCSDPRGLILVYEYVPNGSLADHLHGKGRLSWNLRIDIALQTAMAIEYLHFSVLPPIVHRDITSSNIFVEKDMRVKVGDFGLSRLLVCSETNMERDNSSGGVWTGPQGTPGYLDPDYHRSFLLNEKSDIYSFGVVLLELITGMRAVDQRRDKREMALADMVVLRIQMGLLNQVVDPILVVDGEAVEGVDAVAELAFRCVAADKDDRPDAKEVVAELRRIRGRTRVVGGGGAGVLRSSNSSNVVVPDNVGPMG